MCAMALETGPWLNSFKQVLYDGRDADSEFEVQSGKWETWRFRLGKLAEQIALITPGQKIAYTADVAYTPENQKKIVSLAKDADQLFIEASFLDIHKAIAAKKHHLTASQAGTLAARAGAKEFTIFRRAMPVRGTFCCKKPVRPTRFTVNFCPQYFLVLL